MRALVVASLVACGTPASRPIANRATGPEPPPPAAPKDTTPSCERVAALLGHALPEAPTAAGARARVAMLAQLCHDRTWSAELRTCMGTSDEPLMCTSGFDHDQGHFYSRALVEWREVYDPVP